MPSLIELEEIIENALGENEQLSKKDINKMIDTDGGRIVSGHVKEILDGELTIFL